MEEQKILEAFEEYDQKAAARHDELAGSTEKLGKRVSELEMDVDEIRTSRRANPGGEFITQQQREHLDAFTKWVRTPEDPRTLADLHQKAVDTTGNPQGGYAVPEVIEREVQKRLRDLSPVRRLARTFQVSTSDFKILVDKNGVDSGWVGETDTRSETNTSALDEVAPTQGTVYAYVKATEEALQDIQFDVQQWLVDGISEELAIAEGQAFIDGNGTNKPTGFLNSAPVSTGDAADSPPRAFGTLQYIPTGVAYDAGAPFGQLSTSSPFFFPADVFFDTVHAVRPRYRQGPGVAWLMNSTTAAAVRKLKDAEGRYLWAESLQAGQPPSLLGYPVVEAEDMPDMGTNAHPIVFGNWRRGYAIVDRGSMRITIDDNITTPGYVKFYVRKRVGGKVLDDHAMKAIKMAAS